VLGEEVLVVEVEEVVVVVEQVVGWGDGWPGRHVDQGGAGGDGCHG